MITNHKKQKPYKCEECESNFLSNGDRKNIWDCIKIVMQGYVTFSIMEEIAPIV